VNHLSLFSGIGGIDIAAEAAGFTTVAFCEREPFCQRVLAHRWPGAAIYDDICELTADSLRAGGIDIGGIDLISGGFPCQPYSVAGKRRGENDERALWPEMLRVIKAVRPAWVVGENVAGFVGMGLDGTLADLDAADYEAITFVLPAAAVGAPHQRYRAFIVAHARGGAGNAGPERAGWQAWSNAYRSGAGTELADADRSGQPELLAAAVAGKSVGQPSRSNHAQWPTVHGQGLDAHGPELSMAVRRLWPTPQTDNFFQRRGARSDELGLRGAVAQSGSANWATPNTAQGGPDYTRAARAGSGADDLVTQVAKSESEGGALNPDWVETLMGFPVGWTDLQRAEPVPWPGWPAGCGQMQYDYEPPRTVRRIKNRGARLKALGNAVVPAQVYPILRCIAQLERGKCWETK
jgi:DNA (cytosine-5)-methyltransferase 1